MKHLSFVVGAISLFACGPDTQPQLSQSGSAQSQPLGLLADPPYAGVSAIWGTESRDIRGGHHTHDMVIFISSEFNACADYPRSLYTAGAKTMLLRLSKLDRTNGNVVFVEPDVGSYPVEPPQQPVPDITRGSEVTFQTMPQSGGGADVWIAEAGDVRIDNREHGSGIVSGSFGTAMVPFSIDGDGAQPQRWIKGTFDAAPCSAMNENN